VRLLDLHQTTNRGFILTKTFNRHWNIHSSQYLVKARDGVSESGADLDPVCVCVCVCVCACWHHSRQDYAMWHLRFLQRVAGRIIADVSEGMKALYLSETSGTTRWRTPAWHPRRPEGNEQPCLCVWYGARDSSLSSLHSFGIYRGHPTGH